MGEAASLGRVPPQNSSRIANMRAKSANPAPRLHLDIVLLPEALWGSGLALVDALRVVNTVIDLQDHSAAKRATWRLVDERGQPFEWPAGCGDWASALAPEGIEVPPARVAAREDTVIQAPAFIIEAGASHDAATAARALSTSGTAHRVGV